MCRWAGHIHSSKKNSSLLLHQAIRKYGEENFTHEILEVCESLENALQREIFWISQLKTHDRKFGYNMTFGGDCVMLTDDQRENQRHLTKEAMHRPDVRARHLKIQADPNVRKRKSDSAKKAWQRSDVREKHQVATQRRIASGMGHSVLQLDMDENVIAQFHSRNEASRQTGVPRTSISECIKGNLKHAGSFIWKRYVVP